MRGNPRTSAFFYEEITDKAFRSYLQRISSTPLLSKEEEIRLGEMIQEGDEKAMRKLVESNLRFVVKIAFRYRGWSLSLLDLINEGNIGLLEAARRYSPAFKVKFITYAVWWIRQAILQALANNMSIVPLPLYKIRASFKAREEMTDRGGESGKGDLEDHHTWDLDLRPEEVEEFLQIPQETSIDSPLEPEGRIRPIDLLKCQSLPGADEMLIQKSFRREIDSILRRLQPKERRVIELRFGLRRQGPLTLEKIGRLMRLSRERVRQIEEGAKKRLRILAKSRRLQDFLN